MRRVIEQAAVALVAFLLVPVTSGGLARAGGQAERFYCEERQLGYWFYCAQPEPAKEKAAQTEPDASSSYQARLAEVTEHLRELKARAILEPTEENVAAYVAFQREQLDRSGLFTDVWQRLLWQRPELDYTLKRPVSTLGKQAWLDARRDAREAVIDRGQGARMGLTSKTVPALVLFDTMTKQPIPIGHGLLSADEIMERVFILTQIKPGEDY